MSRLLTWRILCVPLIAGLCAGVVMSCGDDSTAPPKITQNPLPGLDGHPRSIEINGGVVYVGGNFTKAGRDEISANIVAWDGVQWNSLGTGVYLTVHTVAVGNGGIFVGGTPRGGPGGVPGQSEGTALNGLGFWDGAKWNEVGGGVDEPPSSVGEIIDIEVIGNDVYVTGSFTMAGGMPARNVAKWDGTKWEEVGDGINSTGFALSSIGTDLYVGGQFSQAGDTLANRVARWDGAEWHPLGSGIDAIVYALHSSGGILYVGGQFSEAGGSPANNIASWDGSGWSTFGAGVDDRVTDILVDGSGITICGRFQMSAGDTLNHIARWNVAKWESVGGGASGCADEIATDGVSLYTVGEFIFLGGVEVNRVGKWNGNRWWPLVRTE